MVSEINAQFSTTCLPVRQAHFNIKPFIKNLREEKEKKERKRQEANALCVCVCIIF
jgi:hypothetical protein